VHRDLPGAEDLEAVAAHDDRGPFREANPQQVGKPLDDGNEIVPPVTSVDVLIDRGPLEEPEAFLVIRLVGHHDVRARRVAANEVLPLDRRAGGAAADHAAAGEHLVELPVGACVAVRVDDVPLAAAVEPHRVRLAERLHERVAVRLARIGRVEHAHVLEPARDPRGDHLPLVVRAHAAVAMPISAGRRHDHELRRLPAGQLDESLDDAAPFERAAAGKHQAAIRRPVLRRLARVAARDHQREGDHERGPRLPARHGA
jgi:hypothetical protein